MMMYKKRMVQKIAIAFIALFVLDIAFPTMALALTSGPSQPEFSSFEPVATTNMVNEFTGDFTYNLPVLNIPGPDGGGYSMSLSYHSGVSPEEEASWVGYGWTLNPGAINRGKVGYPDDWDGQEVKTWNKRIPNTTVNLSASAEVELWSIDLLDNDPSGNGSSGSNSSGNNPLLDDNLSINLSASLGIRVNNYKGIGYTAGLGSNFDNMASLGYDVSNGSGSFSFQINPGQILNNRANYRKGKKEKAAIRDLSASLNRMNKKLDRYERTGNYNVTARNQTWPSNFGISSFFPLSSPFEMQPYSGFSLSGTLGANFNVGPFQGGVNGQLYGSYSFQNNDAVVDRSVHGYLYSSEAWEDEKEDHSMDYINEKLTPFSKRDKFMHIPFNGKDNYLMTGEGTVGGFSLFNKHSGIYRPAQVTSVSPFGSLPPFEVNSAGDIGMGSSVSLGTHTLKVRDWEGSGGSHQFVRYSDSIDESSFFRFANDKGGHLSYTNNSNSPINGSASSNGYMVNEAVAIENRTGKASHIGYTMNGVMESNPKRAYTKNDENFQLSNLSYVDRDGADYKNQIGEISTVNEGGMRYTYGLPVYSKNEKTMSYGMKGLSARNIDMDISNGYIAYGDVDQGDLGENDNPHRVTIGTESEKAYANSYLLTQITTPDYIDRKMDGPSEDDFGGYTLFKYKKIHGVNGEEGNDWYKWRMPYKGFTYNQNSISDSKDDLLSFQSGEKEIYYLGQVETKTHIAIFHLNEVMNREDAHEAEANVAADDYEHPNFNGQNNLRYLEKITLYKKNADGSLGDLLQTTHFDYDYQLMNGTLNSESGKLTLKKVWFEHEGVVNAKISPYQFHYEYPTSAEADYPEEYDYIQDEYGDSPDFDLQTGILDQNPDYSFHQQDPWGTYRADGNDRYQSKQPWLDQDSKPNIEYDPAAWNLKRIVLPSGGEIHIQYESDEYLFVQNKRAHVMVPLIAEQDEDDDTIANRKKFKLNTAVLGDFSQSEKEQLLALIEKEYLGTGEKIYFKILYKLQGGSDPSLTDCRSDYISGYASIEAVNLVFDSSAGENVIELTLAGDDANGDYAFPRQVCKDFIKTNRAGLLESGDCDPEGEIIQQTDNAAADAWDAIQNIGSLFQNIVDIAQCKEISEEDSYFRIPTLYAKRGGGLRVKRLLMFENSSANQSGQSFNTLYGTEYHYLTTPIEDFDLENDYYHADYDLVSSGVATNEPSGIREENTLVRYMKNSPQGEFDRIFAGKDRKQSEGPLGESLLPSPSVGYAQVITTSIHKGKTHSGYSARKFLTVKDYPMVGMHISEQSGMQGTTEIVPAIGLVANYIETSRRKNQDFVFKRYNVHGTAEGETHFSNSFASIFDFNTRSYIIEEEIISAKQEIEYFDFENGVSVLKSPTKIEHNVPLGRSENVAMETRKTVDDTYNLLANWDANMSLFPNASFIAVATNKKNRLQQFVTSKIIDYTPFVKSVKTLKDGVENIQENIAFDPFTGTPAITKSYDEFYKKYGQDDLLHLADNNDHSGVYTNVTFNAAHAYSSLGQIAHNENKFIPGKDETVPSGAQIDGSDLIIERTQGGDPTILNFSIGSGGDPQDLCDALNSFNPGDFVQLSSGEQNQEDYYHVQGIEGNNLILLPTAFSNYSSVTTDELNVRIINSGRANRLGEASGSITSYGNISIETSQIAPDNLSAIEDFNNSFAAHVGGILNASNQPTGSDYNGNGFFLSASSFANSPDVNIGGQCQQLGNSSNSPIDFVDLNNGILSFYNVLDGITGHSGPSGYSGIAYYVNNGLNMVWQSGFNAELPNAQVVPSDCQNSQIVHNNSFYSFNKISDSNGIANLENELNTILDQPVHPNLTGLSTGTHLDEYFSVELGNETYGIQDANQSVLKKICIQDGASNFFLAAIICDANNPSIQELVVGQCDGPDDFQNPNLERCVYSGEDNIGEFIYQSQTNQIGLLIPDYMNGVLIGERFIPISSNIAFLEHILNGTSPNELICSVDLTDDGSGTFALDEPGTAYEVEGSYDMYYWPNGNNCFPIKISCLDFCDSNGESSSLFNNVISAAFSTYDDDWEYPDDKYLTSSIDQNYVEQMNPYEKGAKGKWRSKASYVYDTDRDLLTEYSGTSSSYEDFKNYNSGTYAMSMFDWNNPNQDTYWKEVSTVLQYSPNGMALEEKNIIDIKSAAKFGYNHALPYIIGQNTDYSSFMFESFENTYDGIQKFEDAFTVDQEIATQSNQESHTGKSSLQLLSSSVQLNLMSISPTDQIWQEGGICKTWVKSDILDRAQLASNFSLSTESGNIGDFREVARSGDWVLLECEFDPIVSGQSAEIVLNYTSSNANLVYIDDLKIHPINAAVVAHVYDREDYKLIASFDDQHFASIYQYNEEGQLIRTKKETERGVKTLQETYYNTKEIDR